MPAETVTLSGPALTGVLPQIAPPPALRALAGLPTTVRLGRVPPTRKPLVPKLRAFVKDYPYRTAPPARVDWYTKAARSLGRMYLNDRYGDCVWAGKMHALGIWSANDPDSGGEIEATDEEVRSQYFGVCGPGDNGCVITRVLDYAMRTGIKAGGRVYKLEGYAEVDWRDELLTKTALHLFGAQSIGINLPRDWTSAAVWDVTNSPIVGGHDVTPCGYDSAGVFVSSWGRVYQITWRAWVHPRWLDECYALLDERWWNSDKLSPAGVNVDALREALRIIRGGGTPPDDGPTPPSPPSPPPPPPPPPPPAPVVYEVVGTVDMGRLQGQRPFRGTATPRPPAG